MFQRQPLALIARLAVLILAALTAGGFAGALWWALDLFSHFRLQYVAAAALMAALLAWVRDRRFALVAAAVAAINLVPVARLFNEPAAAAPVATESSLRVLSLNVLDFNQQYRPGDRLRAARAPGRAAPGRAHAGMDCARR